jgi:hypothetical protein
MIRKSYRTVEKGIVARRSDAWLFISMVDRETMTPE